MERYVLRTRRGERRNKASSILSVVRFADLGCWVGVPIADTPVSRTEEERNASCTYAYIVTSVFWSMLFLWEGERGGFIL